MRGCCVKNQKGKSSGKANTIITPISTCSGSPTLTKSINEYCPAGITRALGGVENGDAKHIEAATVTANRNGSGLTPIPMAHCRAMGAISTAVTVLLMNIVISDVAQYIAARAI